MTGTLPETQRTQKKNTVEAKNIGDLLLCHVADHHYTICIAKPVERRYKCRTCQPELGASEQTK